MTEPIDQIRSVGRSPKASRPLVFGSSGSLEVGEEDDHEGQQDDVDDDSFDAMHACS